MSLIAAAAGVALVGAGHKSPSLSYQLMAHGHARYHVVTADMRSGRFDAKTVYSPNLISIWTLLGRGKPVAAITGTFFSPRSQQAIADVLVDGTLVARGSRGSAIGVNYYGGVKIFHDSFRKRTDWGEYRFGLRGGVMLIRDGKVCPDPKAQRFRDRRIWGRAARTAIGTTKSGKLVMVATRSAVTLSELGKAMASRGVSDGISLDGGGSTALFYQGSLVVPPKRKLCNLFVLSRRPEAEAIAAEGLR
jgi:hypothetical protein